MATNLDLLSSSINKYIVTPINAFGLGGFVFDNEGETSVSLTAEITDHYLEDNSAVQDHIAIRPKKVTLKSYVGELVHREDDSTDTLTQSVVQKLTVLNSFLPTLSRGASQAVDFIKSGRVTDFSLDKISLETVNKVADFWAFAKNLGSSNSRQQKAYRYFKALYEGKFLVSLQTPFEFMSSMAIESVVATQPEESSYISDFTIVLKEIRTTDILNVERNSSRYNTREGTAAELNQGRSFAQTQPLLNVGNMPGLPTIPPLDAGALEDLGDALPDVPADPRRISIDDLVGEYGGQ